MKTLALTTLLSSVFALNIATAAPLNVSEIFNSLDGEYVADNDVARVNFAVSADDLSSSIDGYAILRSLDGERSWGDNTPSGRVNFQVSPDDLNGHIQGLPKTYD